jgi:hypothetical protein
LGKRFGVDKVMAMAKDFRSSLRTMPAFGEKKNQGGPTPGEREESKLPESGDLPMLSTPSPAPLLQQETFHRDEHGGKTGVEMEAATLDACGCTPSSARLVQQGSFQRNEHGC